MKISFYQNVFQKKSDTELAVNEYFENIKSGKWQDVVLNYRAGRGEKTKIPAVTASGIFDEQRLANQLQKHSGILCIDCDQKDNTDILNIRERLKNDKFIYSYHVSVGGFGLALYFKINPSKHIESFFAIEKYLANEYHIIIDQSCKDVSRLRFVSYDPDIYINLNSEKWTQYLEKTNIIPQVFNPIFSKNDIDFCVNQLVSKGIDITTDYHDWIRLAFAFAAELGENGRGLFHKISSLNSDYNEKKCDNKFTNCLKHNNNKTNIGTFFWMCKNAGIQIKTAQTKKIEDVSRIRKKTIGKSGGCKDESTAKKETEKYLIEVEGITDSKEIIEKVFALNDKDFNESDDNSLDQIYEYIISQNIKHNEITKLNEIKGNPITDRDINTLFLQAKELFPKSKLNKDLVCIILDSEKIPSYNPFMDFFKKYKNIKTTGNIEKLFDCIQVPDNEYSNILPILIEKWLLSIIASMHGTYSLLILVLIGDQATNKTKFFRCLLPPELQKYYAESKLDDGKDAELLMSKKLLIVDDEFGGKSKKEAERLKEMAAKQTITARKAYARESQDYNRYAVLGGTSNEIAILNDPTGNRRIIPVQISNIDIDKYNEIDKVDLFMELYHKYREIGDGWMLTKDEIKTLNTNTQIFAEICIEEEMLLKYFAKSDNQESYFSCSDMVNICESNLSKQRLSIKKFGQILRKHNFERFSRGGRYVYVAKQLTFNM
jgi:predicted P-loop ATPase